MYTIIYRTVNRITTTSNKLLVSVCIEHSLNVSDFRLVIVYYDLWHFMIISNVALEMLLKLLTYFYSKTLIVLNNNCMY